VKADKSTIAAVVFAATTACFGGVALGAMLQRQEPKNCTKNNQCRLPQSEDNGYDVMLDKGRDGEIYVWGGR
jgi:hypothetical protein